MPLSDVNALHVQKAMIQGALQGALEGALEDASTTNHLLLEHADWPALDVLHAAHMAKALHGMQIRKPKT